MSILVTQSVVEETQAENYRCRDIKLVYLLCENVCLLHQYTCISVLIQCTYM